MSKNRIKVPALKVPATRAEMEELAGEIAALKITLQKTTAAMDARINNIRSDFAVSLSFTEQEIAEAMVAARAWADANPGEFGKAKSIEMTQAVIGFRTGQPSLTLLPKWTWKKVLLVLVLAKKYLRTKLEVDKEGIIADREELKEKLWSMGVKIVQEETFFVEPKLTEVETRETVPAKP